jgi:hypothetical protein
MDKDLKRVFFHELGHFVAREINQKYFGVIGRAKEISLYESLSKDGHYGGKTVPEIPDGEDRDKSLVSICEAMAVYVYGCFFESIYLEQNFEKCFCEYGRCNGNQDFLNWWEALRIADRKEKQEEIHKNDLDYFDQLRLNKSLDKFLSLNVPDFLINSSVEGKYSVNIDELRRITFPFIQEHELPYLEFTQRIREILNLSQMNAS